MIGIGNPQHTDFESIPIDPFWNTGDKRELKMHQIHAYPAKFPAFLTTKALEFAEQHKVSVGRIADIFCGCGTVAFEAKRCGIDFWGCDINPVATMIAKVKSRKYQPWRLQRYYDWIVQEFSDTGVDSAVFDLANERLRYWYDKDTYAKLSHLRMAIERRTAPRSEYRLFFACAFSNILKATSRWLTKSIKPQVDPNKRPADVMSAFKGQCDFMMRANEASDAIGSSQICIVTGNFLEKYREYPSVDVIVTSPPYVTSYEYADLHQLSSLWLGLADDYRDLRRGSIGSLHHTFNFEREIKRLNNTGTNIVFRLLPKDHSKARSVTKYFLDMQEVAKACHSMLAEGGMAFFVVGNTEYKGVRIDNARHLAESMQKSGFGEISVAKRKVIKKILTPYRDNAGRFTTDSAGRKVYSEEYILVGRK